MDSITSRLSMLKAIAERLEVPASDRTAALELAGAHVERFFESLPARAVYEQPGPREQAMQAFAISESPGSLEAALQTVERYVDGIGHNLGSSRFFAYIPSGGLYESALADYVAAVSNRYSGVGAAAPGATRMEDALLKWLAGVIGFPESAEGDLTSGGSMATLSAIVAAREARGVSSTRVTSSVVYVTTHTHHTFRKVLHVAGLGECPIREIPCDDGLRMDVRALREAIRKDLDAGMYPWLVAATAGTTDAGAVDPLEAIADLAAEFDLWMHVDAAYGGAFALCEEGSRRLAGLDRADSLVLDPHKGFFLPCGIGVVLVRDGQKLFDAYHLRGTYMQDVEGDTERSPCDYSAELTRPFRALRFWLPFKVHGSETFAAALEEKLLLAQYFYDEVQKIPGIEVGTRPDLSIVTFRLRPDVGDANEASKALVEAIRVDGRVFLTSTTVNGRFTLRMAILTYSTHVEEVDLALDAIRECSARICDGDGT